MTVIRIEPTAGETSYGSRSGFGRLLQVVAIVSVIMFAHGASAQTCTDPDDPTVRMKQFLASVIGKSDKVREERAKQVLDAVDNQLEKCPRSLSLHLLKVASLGTVARATGFSDSVTHRYGSKSKAALEDLVEVAPDHPWTMTLEGVWHYEVKRRGGSMGASMLGASVKKGRERLNEAIELAGRDDPAITYAYAIALLSYKAKRNADSAERLLRTSMQVANEHPDDPASAIIMEPIGDLLELLADKEYKDASRLASELL